VRQESKPIQGRFHSYVLVRLPFDSINRVLHEQEAKSHDAEIKKDFDALAERIDKLREEAKARTAPDMVVPLTPPIP
jgi:Ribonuclease G/E